MPTTDEVIEILKKLPKGTQVFTRHGIDDAYETTITIFDQDSKPTVFFGIDPAGEHRNYPGAYGHTGI